MTALTVNPTLHYDNKASAKSGVGISPPFFSGDINAPLSVCAFFCVVKFSSMVGWMGDLRIGRSLSAVGLTRSACHPTEISPSCVADTKLHTQEAIMPNTISFRENPIDALATLNGEPTTTSNLVAEAFGKQHKNIIQKLESLECSDEFNRLNFQPVEYTDQKGEKRPAYKMTKDGFIFLVMGFTGKKAAMVKEAYIDAFNQMQAKLDGAKTNPLAYQRLLMVIEDGEVGYTKTLEDSDFITNFDKLPDVIRHVMRISPEQLLAISAACNDRLTKKLLNVQGVRHG
ncbi:MAG: Rha family transcriptional regulator [Thalassotalea sp.]|nr:Rha family transcriptional regulator [Thalassotalea sp.]